MTITPSHSTLYHKDFLAVQSRTTELIRGQEEKKKLNSKKKSMFCGISQIGV